MNSVKALKPLITIIGTTGVGKSRLAIDLALAVSGSHGREHGWHAAKVINSDSMQVYSGADVITNKVPESERGGVEHLLMSFKQPGEQYVVGQWVNDAVREIDELHRRKTLPIVVGGTAYWMQHLIFPNRLTSLNTTLTPQGDGRMDASSLSPALHKALTSLPDSLLELFTSLPEKPEPEQAFSLHALLTMLDPPMASRWHWKDTRKVLRSLEIIKETGSLPSEIMAEQAQRAESTRYSTLIFWLFSVPEVLNGRLDARVDDMIEQGLLDDVRMLQQVALSGSPHLSVSDIDTTSGIFQAIGFKEFSNYISSTSPSLKQYEESIERTKLSTRQYAKTQVKWIRNKLLPAVNAANKSGTEIRVFLLNVADLDKWDVEIRDVATRIAQDFLDGRELPDPRDLSQVARSMLDTQAEIKDPHSNLVARHKVVCDVCTMDAGQPKMLDEGQEWEEHIRSRKHRRLQAKRDRPKVLRNENHKIPRRTNDFEDILDFSLK